MHTSRSPERYSWLCRDAVERERFFDVDEALTPPNLIIMLFAAIGFAAGFSTIKPPCLLIGGSSFGFYIALRTVYKRFRRPEIALAVGLAVVEAGLTGAVVAGGSQHTAAMALPLWISLGFTARYPARVSYVATAYTAVLMIVAELGFGASAVERDPLMLSMLLVTLLAATTSATAARTVDSRLRLRSVLDPLTGIYNRRALEARIVELESRAEEESTPVCVLVGDIDHFKVINDRHGHTVGDVVLAGVADRLRAQLRNTDTLYRVGGEEFVVLAPGVEVEEGRQLAERLRAAVAGAPIAGVSITMSFGLMHSPERVPFSWEHAFTRADGALYEAKRAGRNLVCVS